MWTRRSEGADLLISLDTPDIIVPGLKYGISAMRYEYEILERDEQDRLFQAIERSMEIDTIRKIQEFKEFVSQLQH